MHYFHDHPSDVKIHSYSKQENMKTTRTSQLKRIQWIRTLTRSIDVSAFTEKQLSLE